MITLPWLNSFLARRQKTESYHLIGQTGSTEQLLRKTQNAKMILLTNQMLGSQFLSLSYSQQTDVFIIVHKAVQVNVT